MKRTNKIKALIILAGVLDLGIILILINLSVALAIGLGILHILWTYIVYNAVTQLIHYNKNTEDEENDMYI